MPGSHHSPALSGKPAHPHAVAFVLKGYPRLSETFIAQEIRALEQRGMDIRIVSLRHPTDRHTHPVHQEIVAPVTYLPEYLHQEPRRVLAAWRAVRQRSEYERLLAIWWRDFKRDPTPNRVRRLGQAMVLAAELGREVGHLHAHFLHTPASVARYAAILCRLPWTCSAHAKDIWTSPEWEKREKLADCRWAVTCTAFNRRHLEELSEHPGRVDLVYHGLDLSRFPEPREPSRRDGRAPSEPIRMLSVGRAVEKKGYEDLLQALAQLPAALHWRLVHVGGGPLLPKLERQARRLGISSRLSWLGPRPQPEVIEQYRAADLFVLASRIAEDGDRDGLPNVLMEAQCQGVPCIATRVSAIPELLEDEVNGLLVPERDTGALARAIERLAREPERRIAMGRAGSARVRARFSFERGIDRLVARFTQVDAKAAAGR